jgi:hypothetical protein
VLTEKKITYHKEKQEKTVELLWALMPLDERNSERRIWSV